MRVLILTHHYPPEVGAPQTRLSATAAVLRQRGHDVRVLTAFPSYPTGRVPPAYRGKVRLSERIDGIRVERTWTFARPGASMRNRLANQLSFAASAVAALPAVGRRDVVLVESPPLFLGLTGALVGRALGAPVVLHVSDLWPAVAIELGALRRPALVHAAEAFERLVYRLSDRLVAVTGAWLEQLVRRGVPREKLTLVTNGVDASFLDPDESAEEGQRARSELGLEGKLVVGCIGTVSNVYDYELILQAAQHLVTDDRFRFLIVGDGAQKADLLKRVSRLGLPNVTLLPAQPRARVRGLLAAIDVSIVPLQPIPFTRGQLPVRVLESLSMAVPVVVAGAGEAERLVTGAEAGLAVGHGDVEALAGALRRLADDPGVRQRLGTHGRQTILARFSRAAVAAQLEAVLQLAVSAPARSPTLDGDRSPGGVMRRER